MRNVLHAQGSWGCGSACRENTLFPNSTESVSLCPIGFHFFVRICCSPFERIQPASSLKNPEAFSSLTPLRIVCFLQQYFGAVATSSAAIALKSARSFPPPEAKLGAQVARELHRSNTTQPILQTLDKISTRAYNPATNQMRCAGRLTLSCHLVGSDLPVAVVFCCLTRAAPVRLSGRCGSNRWRAAPAGPILGLARICVAV